MMRKKIIAGNWKMNKVPLEGKAFAADMAVRCDTPDVDVVFCVPFVMLCPVSGATKPTSVSLGVQNMHFEDAGAYTGEISAPMLAHFGVEYVIIGHSERRAYFNETDETVNKKTKKALSAGLIPIVCCGESLAQREQGVTMEHIRMQVKLALADISASDATKIVIAYEPIWAIGTGKTATTEQAEEACAGIRQVLAKIYDQQTAQQIRIQYGGSVTASNASQLFAQPNIDGALVGGASLTDDFEKIVKYNQ
ncbi:MAG: triose-phosphate isomerase [Defluviitaleaceae bacterium]|nr:triose-phosphate isomerase [Defluviitaleaceae bacterium]